jgi:hypothetical protein
MGTRIEEESYEEWKVRRESVKSTEFVEWSGGGVLAEDHCVASRMLHLPNLLFVK